MWKNERLEKWFYLYAGLKETYVKRFGALEDEADDEEDEEEHRLTEKERKRHEKYLKIGKEGVYHPLSRTDSGKSFRYCCWPYVFIKFRRPPDKMIIKQ